MPFSTAHFPDRVLITLTWDQLLLSPLNPANRQESDLSDLKASILQKGILSSLVVWPHPHLLERKFTATQPNQKWTADITYLPTTEGWLYLAVVLDLFSRKVVGWAMQETLHTEVVLSALEMAQSRRRPRAGLLHHSDQRAGPMGCRLAQDKACNMPASSTGKPLSGWQRCKA